MGKYIREDNEKFHAIAAPLPALYQAVEEVLKQNPGPIEIEVQVRGPGSVTTGFSAEVNNPEELLEILRLTTGR